QRLANQHGDFRLVMHTAALFGNAESTYQRYRATAWLDKQQRLGGHRVVQLLGMFGVVAPHADHLAQRVMNGGAVNVLVLVAHGDSLKSLLLSERIKPQKSCRGS